MTRTAGVSHKTPTALSSLENRPGEAIVFLVKPTPCTIYSRFHISSFETAVFPRSHRFLHSRSGGERDEVKRYNLRETCTERALVRVSMDEQPQHSPPAVPSNSPSDHLLASDQHTPVNHDPVHTSSAQHGDASSLQLSDHTGAQDELSPSPLPLVQPGQHLHSELEDLSGRYETNTQALAILPVSDLPEALGPMQRGVPPLSDSHGQDAEISVLTSRSDYVKNPWNHVVTFQLLDIWAQKRSAAMGRSYLKDDEWAAIIDGLNQTFAGQLKLTERQVKDKIGNMKNRFKQEMRVREAGGTVVWPYYQRMESLLSNDMKANNNVEFLKGRKRKMEELGFGPENHRGSPGGAEPGPAYALTMPQTVSAHIATLPLIQGIGAVSAGIPQAGGYDGAHITDSILKKNAMAISRERGQGRPIPFSLPLESVSPLDKLPTIPTYEECYDIELHIARLQNSPPPGKAPITEGDRLKVRTKLNVAVCDQCVSCFAHGGNVEKARSYSEAICMCMWCGVGMVFIVAHMLFSTLFSTMALPTLTFIVTYFESRGINMAFVLYVNYRRTGLTLLVFFFPSL